MNKEIIPITALRSTEGKTITNKEYSLLSKVVYLGKLDSTDNYFEITDEEADIIRKEIEEEILNNEENEN